MSEAAQKTGLTEAVVNYFRDFKVLKETRSEYWWMQIINFLDCTVFFAVLTITVIFLSENLGCSDRLAGYVITIFGGATTLFLLISGMVTDWLGIRKSLIVSMLAVLGLRAVIVLTTTASESGVAQLLAPLHFQAVVDAYQRVIDWDWWGWWDWLGDDKATYRNTVVTLMYFLMAPFLAMVQTLFQAANKRFTTRRSRSAGFNLWYLFMNVGAFAAGLLIDFVYLVLKLPRVHVFTFGVFAAGACLVLTFWLIRCEEQLYGPDETPVQPPGGPAKRRNPFGILWSVICEPVFWRFVVLITLLIGVRAVFLYTNLLWPKYWLRVIGPNATIGLLESVNPALVVIGLIVLIPVLHRYSVYSMLVYGAIISALSMFVLAIPTFGTATYVASLAALVVLSVGEIIWSPRLTEYTAAIAPEGQEGTYLGLSMVPYFLAKTVVSLASGYMLERWIPAFPEGEPLLRDRLAAGQIPFWQTPSALWIILGTFALGGPLIALLMKSWFTKGAKWEKDEAAVATE
jgi:MFS family permease